MDFHLSSETQNLRDTVRRLVDAELIPSEAEIETNDRVPDRIVDRFREMNLFGLTLPEEHGGIGLNCLDASIVMEQLGRTHSAYRALLTTNNGIGSQALVHYGTDAQKAKYLPRLAQGEIISAFALTEPHAGSDAAAIRTTAQVEGDHYVINGLKHFITNGAEAQLVTVMALTDPNKRARGGITAFLVEKGTEGFGVSRLQKTMGPGGYHQAELVFDNCRVPRENILGPVGDGLAIALKTINHGRILLAASAVGLAQRLLDESVEYAKMRVQFGRPIADFQAIQFMLADMSAEVTTSRLSVWYAAWLTDQKQNARAEAAIAKLHASESLGRVADRAVQIFGGMGYMRELPVERMYREARLYRIVEGTSEIQRIVIARRLLKD